MATIGGLGLGELVKRDKLDSGKYLSSAQKNISSASQTLANIKGDRKTESKVSKTAGGAVMQGLGGAVAGASLGAYIGGATSIGATAGGAWGAAAGAVIGIGAYLLS